MEYSFKIIEQTRHNLLNILNGLNIEEVNKVPANFNNNLVWHLGHIISSHQVLTYKMSGLEPRVNMDVFSKYGKGTKPETFSGVEEYTGFKEILVSSLDNLKADYREGLFKTYNEYTTSYGITLSSIETAIQFVGTHEGVHLGYCMALKRALR